MNIPRETILTALLAQLGAAKINSQPAFVTTSRRLQSWDQVDTANRPALFVVHDTNIAAQNTYGLTNWRLRAVAWVYCTHDANADPSGTTINALLDAVDTQMLPDLTGRQTLGNLVPAAYIDGEILISEGNLPDDTTSVARIPITVDIGE